MSAPMSERQQMRLLKKQQEEEQAAAAAASEAQVEDPSTRRRASKRTSSKNKSLQSKKKTTTLEERKMLARKQAAAKIQEDEEASLDEHTTSQEEELEDFGDDDDSESEVELEEETFKKKEPAVQKERPSRKRRFSEDEESSQNEGVEGRPTERKQRLKKLIRKRTKKASTILSDSGSDKEKKNEDVEAKDKVSLPKKGTIPKKAGGIPKKGDIPRRKPGDTAGSKPGEGKPTSSLLQNIAPGNPAFQTPAINATSASLLTKSMQPPPSSIPPRSASGDAPRMRKPLSISTCAVQQSPILPNFASMTPPPNMDGQQAQPSPPTPSSVQSLEDNENRVLQAIGNMCDSLNRDGRFQIRPGPAIDMSGSFLSEEGYDFFDVDSHGDIMLQAKIPIFPEDFPPGKTEWPLAWWGIVDPALAPSPKVMQVEEKIGSHERTAAIKEWPTRPNEKSQRQPSQQQQQRQQYKQPPPPHLGLPPSQTGPPSSYPPPPHFRSDVGGRGGRGAPFSRGGGTWGRGGRGPPQPMRNVPPPIHGVPPPQFPPGASRGRGKRPGDRPPPQQSNNWRPPSQGRY